MGAQDRATGEVDPDAGIFYKITRETLNNPTVEIAPVNISNGLAWNAANDKFYYVDSLTLEVSYKQYARGVP